MTWGYTDLGNPLLVRFQATFGLTDRADGTVYYLKVQDSPDQRLMLDTEKHMQGKVIAHVYSAFGGPQLPRSNVRLLVRSGRLGYEVVSDDPPAEYAPVRPHDKTTLRINYELILPSSGFTGTEALAYETAPQ